MTYLKIAFKLLTWAWPFVGRVVFGGRPVTYVLAKNRLFLIMFCLFLLMTYSFFVSMKHVSALQTENRQLIRESERQEARLSVIAQEIETVRGECAATGDWDADRRMRELFR
jgi:type II secretory pathway component PulM